MEKTTITLLARLGGRPTLQGLEEDLFNKDGPKGGDVFEFYGEEGVGKTELFLHFVTKVILPQNWNHFEIGGFGGKIIYIDTDYKFSVLRLAKILNNRIRVIVNGVTMATDKKQDFKKATEEDIDSFVKNCLQNVKLVRCSSSHQLICTLHSLENQVCECPEIGLIMLDSISTFYWIDKASNMLDYYVNQIKYILNKLVTDYNLVLFITKAALVKKKTKDLSRVENSFDMGDKSSKSEDMYQYAEFLGNTWHNFIQKRFIMIKEVSQNQSKLSLHCKQSKLTKTFTISDNGVQFS
ncbi:DNA repair protein XRCC2 isoform X2 [Patella vulgata]|uniref:DNA repair protein XRCC2 isoform X2 n=1 Tax=Patella vulgata TaxID=6465 RepID=UPI0024A9D808|nr:DNA repair protein XRCC2 isoform X2 [Patella vulgata]